MGVMGIATDVVREWTRALTSSGNGVHPIFSAIIFKLVETVVPDNIFSIFFSIIIVFSKEEFILLLCQDYICDLEKSQYR